MDTKAQRLETVGKILDHAPEDWLKLTTHRLDIYDESQAKTQFLKQLEMSGDYSTAALAGLPTAYDYIRLGHPLSCVLEWVLGSLNNVPASQVITFTSKTMPILAVLRKETLAGRTTRICFTGDSAPLIDVPRLKDIYGYRFELHAVTEASEVEGAGDGLVVFVTSAPFDRALDVNDNIDITVNLHAEYGSALLIHADDPAVADEMAGAVQHVRRRESIAMTPVNAMLLLREIVGRDATQEAAGESSMDTVIRCIQENTNSTSQPLVGSSGLSIQYAMLMGLVEYAMTQHPGKPICLLIPPNCYGGTNDQARRVAALIPSVTIVDMLVDGGQDMVSSMDTALEQVAERDGVPLVLAEIPTNPRVEVPDMNQLAEVLSAGRQTLAGEAAVQPVFMVDQTFCPNVKLLGGWCSSPVAPDESGATISASSLVDDATASPPRDSFRSPRLIRQGISQDTRHEVEVGRARRCMASSSESGEELVDAYPVRRSREKNTSHLGQDNELASVKTISFASGSKFASGGRTVAGYCTANAAGEALLPYISAHLTLSDNAAVAHQLDTLAAQMPSMPERIAQAYENARAFVEHIQAVLPEAKINFVSETLAEQGFTPSVFSLDLPARVGTRPVVDDGDAHKRLQNVQLIEHMIAQNPDDCKYCVSYGQLKGSYWTIPATSTQGTTKESDKDYIVRVSLAPDVDVAALNRSFTAFCHPKS